MVRFLKKFKPFNQIYVAGKTPANNFTIVEPLILDNPFVLPAHFTVRLLPIIAPSAQAGFSDHVIEKDDSMPETPMNNLMV